MEPRPLKKREAVAGDTSHNFANSRIVIGICQLSLFCAAPGASSEQGLIVFGKVQELVLGQARREAADRSDTGAAGNVAEQHALGEAVYVI